MNLGLNLKTCNYAVTTDFLNMPYKQSFRLNRKNTLNENFAGFLL